MIRLKVKQAIEASGQSMAKISRKADLSYNTVQAICKDENSDVTLSTLTKLAEALNISVFDLIEEIKENHNELRL